MRTPQSTGERGSLKWVQALVNRHPETISPHLPSELEARGLIEWLSPLAHDDYAEYRDEAFLKRLRVPELVPALAKFWPERGPQWDALGRTEKGDIILVEAKAHVGEICSPPCQASPASRSKIDQALAATTKALQAEPRAPWTSAFYQYANRLAHLHFLREQGTPAWLLFIYFTGDAEMDGPSTADEWEAALKVMKHVMGLKADHRLARYVADIFVDVRTLPAVS